MKSILDIIECPICHTRFKRIENSLVCDNNHLFDISKSGYVNLLPPGKEKNSRTGDEKIMIKARSDFLSQGYYSEISKKLASIISDYSDSGEFTVCDMGCGEGYHSLNIAESLKQNCANRFVLIGADASKYGIEYASKNSKRLGLMPGEGIGFPFDKNSQAFFVTANIFHLPINSASVTHAVSMFAPVAWEECRRILSDNGYLIVVSSGENHLSEMRHIIYDNVYEKVYSPEAGEGFEKVFATTLTYKTKLENPESIKNLFIMTPFYYKTTQAGKEKLYSLNSLEVTVSVNYTVFKKQI